MSRYPSFMPAMRALGLLLLFASWSCGRTEVFDGSTAPGPEESDACAAELVIEPVGPVGEQNGPWVGVAIPHERVVTYLQFLANGAPSLRRFDLETEQVSEIAASVDELIDADSNAVLFERRMRAQTELLLWRDGMTVPLLSFGVPPYRVERPVQRRHIDRNRVAYCGVGGATLEVFDMARERTFGTPLDGWGCQDPIFLDGERAVFRAIEPVSGQPSFLMAHLPRSGAASLEVIEGPQAGSEVQSPVLFGGALHFLSDGVWISRPVNGSVASSFVHPGPCSSLSVGPSGVLGVCGDGELRDGVPQRVVAFHDGTRLHTLAGPQGSVLAGHSGRGFAVWLEMDDPTPECPTPTATLTARLMAIAMPGGRPSGSPLLVAPVLIGCRARQLSPFEVALDVGGETVVFRRSDAMNPGSVEAVRIRTACEPAS